MLLTEEERRAINAALSARFQSDDISDYEKDALRRAIWKVNHWQNSATVLAEEIKNLTKYGKGVLAIANRLKATLDEDA